MPRVRLTFLGSGDAFCDWRVNYQNNALVETDQGLVLIDCGMTAVQSMRELGLSVHDVHTVLITHVHADHACPSNLLLERFYGGPVGPRWASTRLLAPPDVLDPLRRSLRPFFDEVIGPEGGRVPAGLDGLLIAVPGHELRVGGVIFRFFPVPHVTGIDPVGGRWVDKPAYGLEMLHGGRRTVWSSDTTFQRDWIVQTARDPDLNLLFHDCTFQPAFPGTVHTHFAQLSTLPADVQARIVLMHHVQVPDDVDVSAFAGAAARHQVFDL